MAHTTITKEWVIPYVNALSNETRHPHKHTNPLSRALSRYHSLTHTHPHTHEQLQQSGPRRIRSRHTMSLIHNTRGTESFHTWGNIYIYIYIYIYTHIYIYIYICTFHTWGHLNACESTGTLGKESWRTCGFPSHKDLSHDSREFPSHTSLSHNSCESLSRK